METVNPQLMHPVEQMLLASYLYYILYATSFLTDAEFDRLCAKTLKAWDKVEHPDKHLINASDLEAGSLASLSEADYPEWIRQQPLVKGAPQQ